MSVIQTVKAEGPDVFAQPGGVVRLRSKPQQLVVGGNIYSSQDRLLTTARSLNNAWGLTQFTISNI